MKIGKPLVVSVPKDTNFHIPEGKYRAKISSVKKVPKQKINDNCDMLRILFEVLVPKLHRMVNLAKAEYPLNMHGGSELRNVLTRLLGKQVFADAAGDSFDLEQLTGMDVEIEIEHVITNRRDEYTYPLVKVRDIRKPGTMAFEEYKEANQ